MIQRSSKVDVSMAFYGKPYQTIVTIKSLMQHSGQHIDKIYLSREKKQPHGDYIGIFKVIDYFRNDPNVKLKVYYPHHQLGLGAEDLERAKTDTRWRHSIMYQYAFEVTDKPLLCVTHNDMLYHGDIIGAMLAKFSTKDNNLAGIGSIGQCWSCPAGPDWANKCNQFMFERFVPSMEEALELSSMYATPRRNLQKKIIQEGRVHMLPECRLNEFCALFDVEKYRKETIPNGTIGCFGGHWGGVDTGTIWSHDMYKAGYTFEPISLEEFATHAFFDRTGSGTGANSSAELYRNAEENARQYIEKHFGPIRFSGYVSRAYWYDRVKKEAWLALIHSYGFLKKLGLLPAKRS